MKQRHCLCLALAAAMTISGPAQAKDEKAWGTASDIAVNGLTLVALGLPIVKGDKQGAFQAGGSIAASVLVSTGLKEAFPEWRPDRSDRKSFPSGHTSTAFAAAATLQNRYGWEIGIPAHVAAAFVGFSRVQADRHHWYDVVAGAALGALGGYLLSKNLAPKGAYVPPTDWLKNRPSISAPQNPVAGAATGGARSTSAYAQAPGNYNTNAPKVAGVDAKTAQFGTPGGAKSSVAPPPVSQPGSAYRPQAPAANAPRYGSGNYAYKAPQTSRPGARNLGRRR